jgi:hypothetical protein
MRIRIRDPAVLRIRNMLVRIRIRSRGSLPLGLWLMDPAADPAIFVIDLQDANKNYFFLLGTTF